MAARPRRTTEYAPAEMGVSIVSGPKTLGDLIGASSEPETPPEADYTSFTVKKVEGGYLVRAETADMDPDRVRERVVTTLDGATRFIAALCGHADAEAAEAEEEAREGDGD
jgi:hypothetical protein